jgi:acyl carrier protein
MSEVQEAILGHIRSVAAGSDVAVTPTTQLLETGLLDSINLVGLLQFLEERFSLSVPDSDIGADLFTSPASLAAYVERRLGIVPAVARTGEKVSA